MISAGDVILVHVCAFMITVYSGTECDLSERSKVEVRVGKAGQAAQQVQVIEHTKNDTSLFDSYEEQFP